MKGAIFGWDYVKRNVFGEGSEGEREGGKKQTWETAGMRKKNTLKKNNLNLSLPPPQKSFPLHFFPPQNVTVSCLLSLLLFLLPDDTFLLLLFLLLSLLLLLLLLLLLFHFPPTLSLSPRVTGAADFQALGSNV